MPRFEDRAETEGPRAASTPRATAISPRHQERSDPAPDSLSKAARLRRLLESPELAFLMESHNGLSAKIAEEAGFEGIWGSGLSISAALGVRDSNEASWTQVLDVLEFMSDATRIPILVDGDTGYGNFNTMRRLVKKLEQRGIAGVCIEDKVFPKSNSFLRGTSQPLADIDEFCGRIKAGKETQSDPDFVLVARVEAFIAGWGLAEALKRAEAYRCAGADAILIHSAERTPREVLSFKKEWGDRLPVIIVPTKYYSTPTEVFREHGFAVAIWANHLMRSCITALQRTASEVFERESLIDVDDRVASLSEVFRLQGAPELAEAEKRYLPKHAQNTRVIVLASARGKEFGELTRERPKSMIEISGAPILSHIVDTYRGIGITDIVAVRGYKKEAVALEGLRYFDNDEAETTSDAFSLAAALPALEGSCIICYGDVLFKKHVPQQLLELDADFSVMVDSNWAESRNRDRYADYVVCSEPYNRGSAFRSVHLVHVADEIDPAEIHGEWMGFLRVSEGGAAFLRELLAKLSADPSNRMMDMAGLMREILKAGKKIHVVYTTGSWLDVDSVDDAIVGSDFK